MCTSCCSFFSIPTRPPVPPIGPGPHIVPDHIGGGGSLGPGASGIGGQCYLKVNVVFNNEVIKMS